MKKWSLLLATLAVSLLVCAVSDAEISTNLKITKQYNKKGKVTVQSYVDDAGTVTFAEDKGYATLKNTYTSGNKLEKVEYLDENGNLVNNSDGYAVRSLAYSMKNIDKETFTDKDGNLVNGPGGYAMLKSRWYEGKLHEETRYYGPDGNPLRSETHYSYRLTEYKVAKDGGHQAISDTYYDADGNLFAGPDGYARVEYAYRGNTKEKLKTTYIGADGELFYNKKAGYAVYERIYEKNKYRQDAYYGADGHLCAGPKGYAMIKYVYTVGKDARTKLFYYDENEEPYLMPDGYYGISQVKDKKGHVLEEIYYGADGEQSNCSAGYSRVTASYNMKGKVRLRRYWGPDGKGVVVPELGYAIEENYYNSSKLISTTYYDANKKPMDCAKGYAYVYNTYEKNKLVSVKYLHADKSPATCPDGYSSAVYTNDKSGNILSEIRYDENGNRVADEAGIDEIRYTWNGNYKETEAYYIGGVPAIGKDGYHKVWNDYNGSGKVTQKKYYDAAGRLTAGPEGFAAIDYEYNTSGKVMSTRYYDENETLQLTPGKDYAYTRQEWNEDGDQYIQAYYGVDENLVSISEGYAQKVCDVDENGNVVKEYYLDESDQPVANKSGIGATVKTYDANKQVTSAAYFDPFGAPMLSKDGYASYQAKFNDKKQQIWIEFFDVDGSPMAYKGYTIRTREYDENGNVSTEKYFDEDEKPVMCSSGYYEIRKTYNQNKKVETERYFDETGKPMTVKDAYGNRFEYNEKGKVSNTIPLDMDGK